MLVAAAVVPTPPLLVPEVAAGAADRDADLRIAALDAVARVLATGPERVVVVGQAPATGPLSGTPDWHRFGVRVPRPDRPLPLPLGIGAWLLGRLECSLPVEFLGVAAGSAPEDCAALGRGVAAGPRTALLVCGDGTARRDEKAPGHLSPESD